MESGVPWCSATKKPWNPARSAAEASESLCSYTSAGGRAEDSTQSKMPNCMVSIVIRGEPMRSSLCHPEGALSLMANLDTQGPFGNTLLHSAVVSNDVEEVRRLLKAGANPRIANREGQTPLRVA